MLQFFQSKARYNLSNLKRKRFSPPYLYTVIYSNIPLIYIPEFTISFYTHLNSILNHIDTVFLYLPVNGKYQYFNK